MPTRFYGFYYAHWEGLNEGGAQGHGVLFIREGRIYGGDSLSCILGEYEDRGDTIIARVRVFPLAESYRSVTGIDNAPWDLEDIRGAAPTGMLDPHCRVHLDAQRYQPQHHAISLDLVRIATF